MLHSKVFLNVNKHLRSHFTVSGSCPFLNTKYIPLAAKSVLHKPITLHLVTPTPLSLDVISIDNGVRFYLLSPPTKIASIHIRMVLPSSVSSLILVSLLFLPSAFNIHRIQIHHLIFTINPSLFSVLLLLAFLRVAPISIHHCSFYFSAPSTAFLHYFFFFFSTHREVQN